MEQQHRRRRHNLCSTKRLFFPRTVPSPGLHVFRWQLKRWQHKLEAMRNHAELELDTDAETGHGIDISPRLIRKTKKLRQAHPAVHILASVSELLEEAFEPCKHTALESELRLLESCASLDTTLELKSYEKLTSNAVCALQHWVLPRGTFSAIRLRHMKLSKGIEGFLAETLISAQPLLQTLEVVDCELTDEFVMSLVINLPANCTLTTINLSGNCITDQGATMLASALHYSCTNLRELDLSRNPSLSPVGILALCNAIPYARHLQVLRIADREHLLPVSVFRCFLSKMERNHSLHTLTLGSETMDRSGDDDDECKDMDVALGYFWQEPAYTACTNRIRFFLRMNAAGLQDLIRVGTVDRLHRVLSSAKPHEQVEACYRILQLQPGLLRTLTIR